MYNKNDNLKTLLHELGIEIALISETWERDEQSLEQRIDSPSYKVISYRRPKRKANRQPGGGAAIIYNDNRFNISKLDVHVPDGVEAIWALVKPKNPVGDIKNIAIASI